MVARHQALISQLYHLASVFEQTLLLGSAIDGKWNNNVHLVHLLCVCVFYESILTNTCNIALCSSLKTLSCNFLPYSIKTCTENWSTKILIHLCHNHYCQNPNFAFIPHSNTRTRYLLLLCVELLIFSRNSLQTAMVRVFHTLLEMLNAALQNTCTNKCKLWKLFDWT